MSFESKRADRELQSDEKLDIMFDLVCMMAEKSDKTKYDKKVKDWNDK